MRYEDDSHINETADALYAHFLSTKQESLKLSDALKGYVEEGSPYRHTYMQYLQRRKGPAADLLAVSGQTEGLQQLVRDGILTPEDLEKCAARMTDPANPMPWIRLRSFIHRMEMQADDKTQAGGDIFRDSTALSAQQRTACGGVDRGDLSSRHAAHQIMRQCQREIYEAAPYLYAAIAVLQPEASDTIAAMGTDGERLLYREAWLTDCWVRDPALVRCVYLHTLLHCLYGHLWITGGRRTDPMLHLAMDVQITCLIEDTCRNDEKLRALLGIYETSETLQSLYDRGKHSVWNCMTMKDVIERELSDEECTALRELCGEDDHGMWPKEIIQDGGCEAGQETRQDTAWKSKLSPAGTWQNIRRLSIEALQESICGEKSAGRGISGTGRGIGGFGIGTSAGDERLVLKHITPSKTDYRTFLRKFTVWQETVETDPENFDYIYYTLGMERYQGMPLIEPLEYREGNRLEQLVIAIDTSGSVKDDIVRRFLEETFAVLSDKENFFSRMEVWIIQCDLVIEEVVKITSKREWDHYLEHMEIIGRGGTDFRPVFRYVEECRAKGEMEKLKALLYYTDGDGAYPTQAPDYEAAFVFVKESSAIAQVPQWARVLQLPE